MEVIIYNGYDKYGDKLIIPYKKSYVHNTLITTMEFDKEIKKKRPKTIVNPIQFDVHYSYIEVKDKKDEIHKCQKLLKMPNCMKRDDYKNCLNFKPIIVTHFRNVPESAKGDASDIEWIPIEKCTHIVL